MTDNLTLWNSLEKTDPARTKAFTRGGGFRGTALNGTYILKRLTEAFGPCGTGWRFVLEEERIEQGHTLKNGDKARVHVVRGHLDYRRHDSRVFIVRGEPDEWHSTSPQFGQTMFVDENKNGVFTDEEAPKKSITDCISKCAVLLGVGADIHLGLFDDHKYVNQRQQEERDARTPPPPVPPPAPKPNGNGAHPAANRPLTEIEERSLDRQSMRDMAHETLDHDPHTGEIIEHERPTGTEDPRWSKWGDEAIAAFNETNTPVALSKLLQLNEKPLESCQVSAPNVYGRVISAYGAKAAALSKVPVTDATGLV